MTTLQKGDKAPDFSSIDENGNPISLNDFKGKKIVIFFYPKANTPGCTLEACNLRDNFDEFTSKNYAIIGVSADSPKAQLKFKEKYHFPFPLVADETKEMLTAYQVWGPKKFMGRTYDGIHRTTFLIDENGLIDEVITNVKTINHTKQILK